ncbi:uncharacterized protein PRCAT00005571001 [Priceomyces carsonii]|uniref:uncharacterized protein n=1 Tax=Priceomyces carsonii TaxID=28549 RepID=UPI002EDB6D4A|nr:unnamed protein product [Priceomyces carsonii]
MLHLFPTDSNSDRDSESGSPLRSRMSHRNRQEYSAQDDGESEGMDHYSRRDLRYSGKYLDVHSETDQPLSPGARSLLTDDTGENDINALTEGLNYALGTSGKDANWLPLPDNKLDTNLVDISERSIRSAKSTGSDRSDRNSDDLGASHTNENYTDNIPMENLGVFGRRRGSLRPVSPFDDSNRSYFANYSMHTGPLSPAREPNDYLEAGHFSSNSSDQWSKNEGHASPSKFSEVIARVSDRIAGSGAGTPHPDVLLKDQMSAISDEQAHERTSLVTPLSVAASPFADPTYNNHEERPLDYKGDLPEVVINDAETVQGRSTPAPISDGLGLYMNKDDENTNKKGSVEFSMEPDNIHEFIAQSFTKSASYTPSDSLYLFGKSLKLFSPQSKTRRICHRIASNRATNMLLLFLLVSQVLLLSYRQWNPLSLKGYVSYGYVWTDYILIVINVAYTIEIFVRIIAYGFIDDHAMYEELGLPYPESEIGKRGFNLRYIWKFIDCFSLLSFLKPEQKRSNYHNIKDSQTDSNEEGNWNSSEELDVKEIDLDDNSNEKPKIYKPFGEDAVNLSLDLGKKYNLTQKTLKSTNRPKGKDNLNLANEPIHKSQLLRHKNTLLKPDIPKIDQLQLRRAYLRNSWHRIDFLSMVTFWISLLLSIERYDVRNHINLFRTLSCLRILRLCNLTTGTTTILTACKIALPQLFDVAIFICCFWLFFGIIGVQSFKSSLTRNCVWQNPNDSSDTFRNEDQFCGSYLDLNGSAMPFIQRNGELAGVIKGFRCPKYSKCISGDNPYGGTVNFDNIFQSLEMVFVIMSANTFTDIMYDTMDTDNLAACLFFMFTIFILTVWLINVFIAVIVASFNVTRLEAAAEKERHGKRKGIWAIFKHKREITTHTESVNFFKKHNFGLRLYYKFEAIFVVVIFFDLFIQCFRKYDMSKHRGDLLYKLEAAITLVLLVEIILRLLLHFPNWRLFFYSKRNNFDLFLAVTTSVIIIPLVKRRLGHGYYWLTVFQLLRFYRVVLSQRFTRNLWLKIMKNIRAIIDIALFFFILTYLSSILLNRYFEGVVPKDDIDDIDFPMHTLPNSFVALYVITSTENWTDILYSLQEYSHSTSERVFGAIFLIAWFIISNMVLLNIFIAVIAHTLEVSEEGKRKQQLLQFIDNMTERLHSLQNEVGLLSKLKNKVFRKRGLADELEKAVVNLLLSGTAVNDFLENDIENEDGNETHDTEELRSLPQSGWKRRLQIYFWRVGNIFTNPFYMRRNKNVHELNNFNPASFAKSIITERKSLISKQNKFLKDNPRFNDVFYVMGPRHRLRRFCQRLVKPSYGERINGVDANHTVSESFNVVMFLATIGLVITACYFTPLYQKKIESFHGKVNWTFYVQTGFNILFTIEFLIKIIADGLIFTPNAYMRSSWNLIDLCVLISLWIDFIAFLKNDGDLSRIVRGLKALRALRLLTISETAKNNFHNTIISGFWKIINAALISLCLLYPFSIWGLNIFNGRLGYCLDGSSTMKECFNEYENEVFNWEIMSPNVYTNPPLEFNRFATAFSTLFEIVSLEGWVDLLLDVMASTGVGTPPLQFASPFNGFFVILFNFTSIVFILTLFVSVIISNYSQTTGRAYMTKDQISWYQVRKYLVQVKPSSRRDESQFGPFRKFCYMMTVEKNPYWGQGLSFVLLMHVLALLLECFPSYNGLYTFRVIIFVLSTVFFTTNACMLLIGQGLHTFIRYKWNLFNFFVSVGALITTIIAFFVNDYSPFININKLFLVGALAFIIPRSNRLSQLLRFASASVPSLLSLSFTWGVMFLVFAIAMNQIFGMTRIGPNSSGNINLRSVPKAMILLFRCSFGEGWNYIMNDFAIEEPYCSTGSSLDNNDCGNKQYAYILFIAWNIISMYIFLNMFISLILESFSYINQTSSYGHLMERKEIRKFKRTWQKFDPEGTGFIKPFELPKLLHSLNGSFSFHLYSGVLEIPRLCNRWFIRNNPSDPYDITINYSEIDETLEAMDIPKIRQRRYLYERFLEEALLNMELNNDPGISFTRILLQLPLYTAFEAGQCLNLIDFLERRLLLQKVEKRIHTKRVYETIAAYACRWKYKKDQLHGIRDPNIDFGKELRRNSYLTNKDLEVSTPLIHVTDERDKDIANEDHTFMTTYQDDDDFEEQKDTRNVYEPKSPVQIYNAKEKAALSERKLNLPKLFVQVPNRLPSLKAQSPVDDFDVSPFADSFESGNSGHGEENHTLIDLTSVGETLENSSWGDAFKEIRSEKGLDRKK